MHVFFRVLAGFYGHIMNVDYVFVGGFKHGQTFVAYQGTGRAWRSALTLMTLHPLSGA